MYEILASNCDAKIFSRMDKEAKEEIEECQIFRRQRQKDALDILADGPSMNGPGIDDSV